MRVLPILMAAVFIAGCAGGGGDLTPLSGEQAESQWELLLREGDARQQFTAAMAVSREHPATGRLYIILPYGQTIGKCALENGRAICRPMPGTAPLLRKTAEPLARMTATAAADGGHSIFTASDFSGAGLKGRGWRLEREDRSWVYREDGAGWELRLTRTK